MSEEEYMEAVEEMRMKPRRVEEAHQAFVDHIVYCHDELGMTFREIGEQTEFAHSWIYKLYKRRKRT